MAKTTSNTLTSDTRVWLDGSKEVHLIEALRRRVLLSEALVFTAVQNDGECMIQLHLRDNPTKAVSEEARLKVVYFIMGYKAALGWD